MVSQQQQIIGRGIRPSVQALTCIGSEQGGWGVSQRLLPGITADGLFREQSQ
jgi:hypothetical protein